MTKVYVVMWNGAYEWEIREMFSSRSSAEKYIEDSDRWHDMSIEEWEVHD